MRNREGNESIFQDGREKGESAVPHVVGAAEQGSRVLWFFGSLNARPECHMKLPAGRLRAKKTAVIPLCITCRTCSCGKFYISNVFMNSHGQIPRSPFSEAGILVDTE